MHRLGLCAQKCPKKVDDNYNAGMGKRKAIYLKYSQTVPLQEAIDGEHCLYTAKGKCRACEKFCPTGAIKFTDTKAVVTVNVGAVILASGYQAFDPGGIAPYGYGRIPDVVTGLEYERLLSASGPNQGHLLRLSDHKEPKRTAWVQCVGSRSTHTCANGYCSMLCCMYAVKQAIVTSEHIRGDGPDHLLYGFEEPQQGIRALGRERPEQRRPVHPIPAPQHPSR